MQSKEKGGGQRVRLFTSPSARNPEDQFAAARGFGQAIAVEARESLPVFGITQGDLVIGYYTYPAVGDLVMVSTPQMPGATIIGYLVAINERTVVVESDAGVWGGEYFTVLKLTHPPKRSLLCLN